VRRTSGPENFQSSAKKDFFNNIPSEADIPNPTLRESQRASAQTSCDVRFWFFIEAASISDAG
jgi:hypothetical protein